MRICLKISSKSTCSFKLIFKKHKHKDINWLKNITLFGNNKILMLTIYLAWNLAKFSVSSSQHPLTKWRRSKTNLTRWVVFRKGPTIYQRKQTCVHYPNWFAEKYLHFNRVLVNFNFTSLKTHCQWSSHKWFRKPLSNCSMANLQFKCPGQE